MRTLPFSITRYLEAVNAHNVAAMAACFAPDATVRDEGREYCGISAITDWIEATTNRYKVRVETTGVREQAGETIVTNRVEGTFPGSPLSLQYHFALHDDRIAFLAITT